MPTPNVTAIPGIDNTGLTNANTRVRDVDPRLFYKDADKYPFVSALFAMGTKLERTADGKYEVKGSSSVKQRPTKNPKFEWTESERLKFAFSPTAAVTAVATSISVSTDDDDYFVAGMHVILVNAAGQVEEARVTAVGAGSLTVTRNVGSTGAIALATSDKVYIKGVQRAENSVSTEPVQAKSETLYNYVSFVSEPYGVSIIQEATEDYNGDPFKRLKMEALDRMKQRLEIMIWLGRRDLLNSTTNPIYCNGGIFYFLQNVFTDVPVVDVGGPLTRQGFEAGLQKMMRFGSRKKAVVSGSAGIAAINGFVTNQIRPASTDIMEFGTNIQMYRSARGEVAIMYEPLFDEITALNGTMVVVDFDRLFWRYLAGNGKNLNLTDHDDIQENDRSARKGEWLVVGGVQVTTGQCWGIFKNVQ